MIFCTCEQGGYCAAHDRVTYGNVKSAVEVYDARAWNAALEEAAKAAEKYESYGAAYVMTITINLDGTQLYNAVWTCYKLIERSVITIKKILAMR